VRPFPSPAWEIYHLATVFNFPSPAIGARPVRESCNFILLGRPFFFASPAVQKHLLRLSSRHAILFSVSVPPPTLQPGIPTLLKCFLRRPCLDSTLVEMISTSPLFLSLPPPGKPSFDEPRLFPFFFHNVHTVTTPSQLDALKIRRRNSFTFSSCFPPSFFRPCVG